MIFNHNVFWYIYNWNSKSTHNNWYILTYLLFNQTYISIVSNIIYSDFSIIIRRRRRKYGFLYINAYIYSILLYCQSFHISVINIIILKVYNIYCISNTYYLITNHTHTQKFYPPLIILHVIFMVYYHFSIINLTI